MTSRIMLRAFMLPLLLLSAFSAMAAPFDSAEVNQLPTAYRGRIRPMEAASRLWLEEYYGRQTLKKNHRSAFQMTTPSATALLWHMHFLGSQPWEDAPLILVEHAETKASLDLPQKRMRFSLRTLRDALPAEGNERIAELRQKVTTLGAMKGVRTLDAEYRASLANLQQRKLAPKAIAETLSSSHPLAARLKQAGTTLLLLPSAKERGTWFSLATLKLQQYNPNTDSLQPVHNFTIYPNSIFEELRTTYLTLERAVAEGTPTEIETCATQLALALQRGYRTVAGQPYLRAHGKSLYYPTTLRLRTEGFYYRTPLTTVAVTLYSLALIAFLLGTTLHAKWLNRTGMTMIVAAFALHTVLLGLRCFILLRPPVSNMFETVLYVPWVAVATSFGVMYALRSRAILVASAGASIVLLLLLKVTGLDASLDNVQAVLDSQYWLLIHVLMVVGSYGVFALSGVLAHFYLGWSAIRPQETERMQLIGKAILQTLYLGTALLVTGTILGGVWAAESWGRFWDWDPKESWAFISSCLYLIVIHLYRFGIVSRAGLAIGAVLGLLTISFTWYGVNYILGTGLHSYGFGNGGEEYYYLYLLGEIAFLAVVAALRLSLRPRSG